MWRAWSCCSWPTREQERRYDPAPLAAAATHRSLDASRYHRLSVCLQDDAEDTKGSAAEDVQGSHASLGVPEQSRSGGPAEEEEPAVSSKELGDWLRQHPSYTMDMAAFTPVGSAHLHRNHARVAFRDPDYFSNRVFWRLIESSNKK